MRSLFLRLVVLVSSFAFSHAAFAQGGDVTKWPTQRLERAVAKGDMEATNELAYRLYAGDRVAVDEARAVALWIPLAEKENVSAMYYLGRAYMDGRGTEQDPDAGVKLYKRGAKLGDLDCVYGVGYAYCIGKGVEKDEAAAVRCFSLGAKKGHAASMAKLGMHYEKGEGVEQDFKEAVRWYQAAADKDQPWAIYSLAWMYVEGTGVEKDGAAAGKLFQRGAKMDQSDCMYMLGSAYYKGEFGFPKDHQTAFRWAMKSANADCLEGMVLLGCMYRDGIGVARNKDEARKWLKKAADLGDEVAVEALQAL